MTQYTKRISKKKEPEFCWFCNETVKGCEHQHNREQKKMNGFLNWLNHGGDDTKCGVPVIDNHYTQYGQGYRDAIFHVYVKLTKTIKMKGFESK